MHQKNSFLIAALLCAAPLLPAQTTYLSDSFLTGGNEAAGEYNTGAFLGQSPNTIGFDPNNAWSGADGGGNNGLMTVDSIGLTYAGLQTSGGSLDYTRVTSGGSFTVNKNFSRNTTGLTTYGELWGAMLFRFNDAYEGTSQFDVGQGFTIRVDDTNGDSIDFSDNRGSDDLPTVSVTLNADTTYLLLFRSIGNDDFDTLDVWLNPDLSGGEGGLGNGNVIDFTGDFRTNGPNFGSVLAGNFSFGGDANQTIVYDEIRYGDSFSTVTAIPEPGTLALVGIALGSLLLFRRHRS